MSAELYAMFVLSFIIITELLILIFLMRKEHARVLMMIIGKQGEKELEWKQERQQLLDRIQASSFAEYKTQEVRVIKAQSGGEMIPLKLEQL